jgi:hypothetical protein
MKESLENHFIYIFDTLLISNFRVLVVVRSEEDRDVHYIRTDFEGVETYIINRVGLSMRFPRNSQIFHQIQDGRSPSELLPKAIQKIKVDSHHPAIRKPWVNFTVPKGLEVPPSGSPCIVMTSKTEIPNTHVEYISDANGLGRECAGYLYYIITHYNNLPDYIQFSHGPMQRAPKLVKTLSF